MSPFLKIIQPSGYLTGNNAKQLRYQIDDLLSTGVDIVLVDLQEVSFIDSFGLGALIAAQRIANSSNCKLYLCSISAQVKMLFEINKMERLFEIFTDRNEFEAALITRLDIEPTKQN